MSHRPNFWGCQEELPELRCEAAYSAVGVSVSVTFLGPIQDHRASPRLSTTDHMALIQGVCPRRQLEVHGHLGVTPALLVHVCLFFITQFS